MSCYHPLKAVASGQTVNGKTNYHFLTDAYLMEYQAKNGHPFPEEKITYLPCGKCIGMGRVVRLATKTSAKS
jgi:hypothetical protein